MTVEKGACFYRKPRLFYWLLLQLIVSTRLSVCNVSVLNVLSDVLENGTNNVCFSNMKLLITRLVHYERSLL